MPGFPNAVVPTNIYYYNSILINTLYITYSIIIHKNSLLSRQSFITFQDTVEEATFARNNIYCADKGGSSVPFFVNLGQ